MTWRLVIEAPDGRIWGANDGRPHWTLTNRRRQEWRLLGFLHAREAHWPRLQAAELHITIHLRNWRTADAINYVSGPSLKGLIDGLVNAKVVPDDQDRYLRVEMPTLAPLGGGKPRVVLEIRDREDFPEDFPTGGRIGFREHLLAPTDDGFICRRCGRFSRDEHSDETCLGEEEGGGS